MADKKKPNYVDGMKIDLIKPENVWCNSCVFRAKSKDGATLAYCDVYPRLDKPMGVLLYGKECDYYVDENTK